MNSVEYVAGTELLTELPLPVFSEEALEFLNALSRVLLHQPAARAYPDVASLGFWCRKSNLQALANAYPEKAGRLGRGLCLHIAPGNVPINFAFSYVFGLLSGCSNLVRLPSRPYPQVELVCREIEKLLPQYPEVENRTAFVRYSADNAVTAQLSARADARIIWGGDWTVSAIRSLPCRPRCVDVCFADRYSVALLNPEAIAQATEEELRTLAGQFYNDTYLMDQNACSSPQLVLWTSAHETGRVRFWDALHQVARRQYRLQEAVSIDKYMQLMSDILRGTETAKVWRRENYLYGVELTDIPEDLTQLRGKAGYFYEYVLKDWSVLAARITEKFQTVTYYGVDAEAVRRWVLENHVRGIDRIVPVGNALDIGILWDGYDLVRTLSRVVDVR